MGVVSTQQTREFLLHWLSYLPCDDTFELMLSSYHLGSFLLYFRGHFPRFCCPRPNGFHYWSSDKPLGNYSTKHCSFQSWIYHFRCDRSSTDFVGCNLCHHSFTSCAGSCSCWLSFPCRRFENVAQRRSQTTSVPFYTQSSSCTENMHQTIRMWPS